MAALIITPFNPTVIAESSCLASSYYGSFAGSEPMSVFIPDAPCTDLFAANTSATLANIVPLTNGVQQLVWLEQQQVEPSLKFATASFRNELDALLDTLTQNTLIHDQLDQDSNQEPLNSRISQNAPDVFYRTPTSMLISVNPETARTIDQFLPRFWKSTLVPQEPVPYMPVPTMAVDRIKKLLSTARFDSVVEDIVEDISYLQMENNIKFLTGEDKRSGIVSRHSFAEGSRIAAKWLKARFEDTGASCRFSYFREGFAPNVVCRYSSIVPTNTTVVLGAHYDSRGSFGSTRAPGANDDGSGITALLGIARTIYGYGITFRKNVELVAFAGEEQGLVGSRAYAQEARAAEKDILLMIQADMLAYRARGERAQVGLPARIGTPEVAQLVSKFAALYSPELFVGYTTACCSDHQSFHEQGYPATQVFERAGLIADPEYHNSHDLSNRIGYDLRQVKSIAKVEFATLLHAAEFEII